MAPSATVKQGFKQWKSGAQLSSGGSLAEMSRYDRNAASFTHRVEIYHADAFTVRPVILTEGSLAGRHALILEPITTHFRFMDLPPEIRQEIYELVVREEEPIMITTYKPARAQKVARRMNAPYKSAFGHKSDVESLLRICKQVSQEAATTLYGKNTFEFTTLGAAERFLTGTGTMRQHLRNLVFDSYSGSKGRWVFPRLSVAKNLRSITLRHGILCIAGRASATQIQPAKLAQECGSMLTSLHATDGVDVVGLFKVRAESYKCPDCDAGRGAGACSSKSSGFHGCSCEEKRNCAARLEAELRAMVAKTCDIEG